MNEERLEESIASFVTGTSFTELEEEVVSEARRRVMDSLALARASISSPPASAFRKALPNFPGSSPLIGGGSASADASSFYNTLLIRYLDFNDTYLSLEPLHPSDMIGAILPVASLFRKKWNDVFLAIAIGYEIGVHLCDASSLRTKGYDHVNYLGIATAAALSSLLSLDHERTISAISMSIVPSVALRQSRVGKLSMWKAGAAAAATRNAVFAALAALNGFTAPDEPLTGRMGFINVVCRDFDAGKFTDLKRADSILKTFMKKYPVEYHAQSAVDLALKARMKVSGDIRHVRVRTYEAGRAILADPEKWEPANRETADHSLPFIVSAALVTGNFWLDTYSLLDSPVIRGMMKKVEVVEEPQYTAAYPHTLPTSLEIDAEGGEVAEYMEVPEGHSSNPLTDAQLREKFLRLTSDTGLFEELASREGDEYVSF